MSTEPGTPGWGFHERLKNSLSENVMDAKSKEVKAGRTKLRRNRQNIAKDEVRAT
jgi:hypothetical protein